MPTAGCTVTVTAGLDGAGIALYGPWDKVIAFFADSRCCHSLDLDQEIRAV
jgi:hypothetical protein